MVSLLLVVFLVELAAHLVNTLGASTVNNLVRNPSFVSIIDLFRGEVLTDMRSSQLWSMYTALPTQTSRQASDTKKVQKEYLAVRKELQGTSSQDQFAKWAKLRRQHDKLLEQLEKMSKCP